MNQCCISYYSYIKPQRLPRKIYVDYVVYHTIPTSNHNHVASHRKTYPVVYHTIPTSNHNMVIYLVLNTMLYIILFLHQTTTVPLYLLFAVGCISYYSYIKPQHKGYWCQNVLVVYHTIPTSNHNYLSQV